MEEAEWITWVLGTKTSEIFTNVRSANTILFGLGANQDLKLLKLTNLVYSSLVGQPNEGGPLLTVIRKNLSSHGVVMREVEQLPLIPRMYVVHQLLFEGNNKMDFVKAYARGDLVKVMEAIKVTLGIPADKTRGLSRDSIDCIKMLLIHSVV